MTDDQSEVQDLFLRIYALYLEVHRGGDSVRTHQFLHRMQKMVRGEPEEREREAALQDARVALLRRFSALKPGGQLRITVGQLQFLDAFLESVVGMPPADIPPHIPPWQPVVIQADENGSLRFLVVKDNDSV